MEPHDRSLDSLTRHAAQRLRQRAISRKGLEMALGYGMRIEQNGAQCTSLAYGMCLPVLLHRKPAGGRELLW